MTKAMVLALALLLAAWASSTATAQTYFCDRPREPYVPYAGASPEELETAQR